VSDIIFSLSGDNLVIIDVLASLQKIGPEPSEEWLIIDGYFDDWHDIQKYPDTDWNEYQESPEFVDNPNVDIDKYAGITQGAESFFYLSVKGNMLAGVMIPSQNARAIPSFDSGSGPIDIVNPISDTTEPSPLPELYGDDVIYVFLDTNGEVPYGFRVNDSFYADQLIEIKGQYGLILSSELYDYSSMDSMEVWDWTLNHTVDSAAAGNELEFMVPGLASQFKTYFHLISWDDSEDYSDGFWVMIGESKSRTDPTWLEHTIQSNYNGAWDIFAIDLDRDGDIDVLGAAAGTSSAVTWWENEGSESFTKRVITGSYGGANSVFAIDIDNDGYIDVTRLAWESVSCRRSW
jgi:hypothetical protein